MPQIIAFTSPKGGNGATFVCAMLSYMLSRESNKVLSVDMCFEKASLDFALGFENDYIYTLEDVVNGHCSFEDAVCGFNDVSFVRGGYEQDMRIASSAANLLRESDYDYILVDTPPGFGSGTTCLADIADTLVVVTEPSYISQKICSEYVEGIPVDDIRLVVNKIIPAYISSGVHMTVDEIIDSIGIPLLGIAMWNPLVDAVIKQGTSVGNFDDELRQEFSNMCSRIMGKSVPAYDTTKNYDCFKIIKNKSNRN